MVTIIKKGTTKSRILQLLNKIKSRKGIDAFKYCGVIKLNNDPLVIQKQMRNEWK
jgi:hypothetical protein